IFPALRAIRSLYGGCYFFQSGPSMCRAVLQLVLLTSFFCCYLHFSLSYRVLFYLLIYDFYGLQDSKIVNFGRAGAAPVRFKAAYARHAEQMGIPLFSCEVLII